jgi:hypothetical protein
MKRSVFRLALGMGALFIAAATATSSWAQGYMMPTKQHEAMIKGEEGVWDAEVSLWPGPDADPMMSKAVETNKALGKLWLTSELKGDFGGEKFTGQMHLGYDPIKKKYIGVWVDTLSPFMQTMEGDWDEKTMTATMMATGVDAQSGKEVTTKMVTRYKGDDEKVFEMYMPVEGQKDKWWKVMEAKYKKRK